MSFTHEFGGDGRADLDEGGREAVHGVDEGGVGVVDGDANKLYASTISAGFSE